MLSHERIFALLTSDGTACTETGLRESDFTPERVATVERAALHSLGDASAPVLGTWTDVTDNSVIAEAVGIEPTGPAPDDVTRDMPNPKVWLCAECVDAYRNGIEPGETACEVRAREGSA